MWQKNFQSFTVICSKPHVASSICLRATIFQKPEGALWTHCMFETYIRKDNLFYFPYTLITNSKFQTLNVMS
jgi:hypothetical protein